MVFREIKIVSSATCISLELLTPFGYSFTFKVNSVSACSDLCHVSKAKPICF